MDPADPQQALLEEATKRSGLVWLTVPGPSSRARPVWHLWHDGAVWLLVARADGSPEQPAPGLLTAGRVTVTVRSRDKGGRLLSYGAGVEPVEPDTAAWREVLPLLLDKRLNVPGGAATALDRWRRECAVVRLVPELPLLEGPPGVTAGPGAGAAPTG